MNFMVYVVPTSLPWIMGNELAHGNLSFRATPFFPTAQGKSKGESQRPQLRWRAKTVGSQWFTVQGINEDNPVLPTRTKAKTGVATWMASWFWNNHE